MPDASTFAMFALASLALLIVPGPAVLYIVTRSIDQGRTAGIVSTLGIHVGTLVHIGAAAVGLSALVVSSALAFNTIKYLGAAYLIWLGVRKIAGRDDAGGEAQVTTQRLSRIFYQGILVNILNPKTALFFLAFLPQFVDVSKGHVGLQILSLGTAFMLLGMCSDGLYAVVAASAGSWLRGNARFARFQRYFSGGIFVTLGVAAALSGSRSTAE